MRQDVKIGILVGGLVIVAAVIWFVATGGGGPEDTGETATGDNEVSFNTGGQDDQPDDGGGRADTGGPRGAVTPVVGDADLDRDTDDDRPPRYDHGAGPGPIDLDTDDVRVDRDPVTPITGRGSLPDDDDRGSPIDISTDPLDDPIDISSDPIDEPIDDDDQADRVDRDVPDTYRVVEGDQGFWGIAKKLYGAGRYYYLIAEANPDADPTRLRAGQVLRIPPLPREPSRADAEAEAMADAPRGSTTYTVEAGDAGFWGIAKKKYGAGKYYYLIAEANPDANPARLQPGQVLVIPPLPEDAEERRPVGHADDDTTGGSDDAPAGYRVYIVQEEDQQGFWGIAKKFYGEGSLYVAIERANPDVDSNRLRVGQRLLLPSDAEARRLAGRDSREDSDGGADNRPDEPDDLPVFD